MSTKTFTEVPDGAKKIERKEQKERKEEKYTQPGQPAWKPGGTSAAPQPRNTLL
jgi:hypothetical protein